MTAEEVLESNGYEDVLIFKDFSYDDALIGVSSDNRAIYDYEKMVEWLMRTQDWSYEDSVEWIDYNTLGFGTSQPNPPIIMFPLER